MFNALPVIYVAMINRFRTDPGKVWKVIEFKVEIFQALKNWKMITGMEKSGKIVENYEADLEI